ncbi:hypothetical protein RDI58_011348 [Solanum bulbocastanum]|uniref:Uncharacterized protein n=1 Tax=Solanum bulbocastanum TaxID=147425 RepID=A0AAN8YH81_SOLBU
MAMLCDSQSKLLAQFGSAMSKKVDVDMILKSQEQILGEASDGKEKAKSRERDREAARIAISNIKRTVNFDDGFLAERELLAIMGAPQQILGKAFDGEEMKKKTKKKVTFCEEQLRYLQEEKAKSKLKKDREAARIAIASMKRMVNFGDAIQAEIEFLTMIHAPLPNFGKVVDEEEKDKEVELLEKQLQEVKVKSPMDLAPGARMERMVDFENGEI